MKYIDELHLMDIEYERRPSFWRRIFNRYVVVTAVVIALFLGTMLRPPKSFPSNTTYSVASGSPVALVAEELESKSLIRSPGLFIWLVRTFSPNTGILAGEYFFKEPRNAVAVAWRLVRGDSGIPPVKLVVPEGTNVFELAKLISTKFPHINESAFVAVAKEHEGYLFPDTYYLPQTADAAYIIKTMRDHFDEKIVTIQSFIEAYGKSLSEVIAMASYLEEEARLIDTRRIVAGILWRRIQIGMPLQVDSTFQYVNGKNSYTLTLDDLAIDSPYNTYKYKGFTPTPISNPGLDSILAAVTPTNTKYLYFLTDHNGNMRYAVTHDEHVANKERYLR